MVTQAALLADTYVRRRGLANGIAFSGSMAGFLAALPAQMLITHAGWRGAFVGYVVVLLLLVPAVWRTCRFVWCRRRRAVANTRRSPCAASS